MPSSEVRMQPCILERGLLWAPAHALTDDCEQWEHQMPMCFSVP